MLDFPDLFIGLLWVCQSHCSFNKYHIAINIHFVEGEGLFELLVPAQLFHLLGFNSFIAVLFFIEILEELCFLLILYLIELHIIFLI